MTFFETGEITCRQEHNRQVYLVPGCRPRSKKNWRLFFVGENGRVRMEVASRNATTPEKRRMPDNSLGSIEIRKALVAHLGYRPETWEDHLIDGSTRYDLRKGLGADQEASSQAETDDPARDP